MSKTYQIGAKLLVVSLFSITSLSCNGNPSHSLPVEGTIDIEVTSNGIICFSPNFSSATFANKPYNGLKGIKYIYVIIYSTWNSEYKDQFKVISDTDEVCITENNFDFEENLYEHLVHGAEYNLIISGKTSDLKHNIHFTNEFYYP